MCEQLADQVTKTINLAVFDRNAAINFAQTAAYASPASCGLNAVAAPVFTFSGEVVAALSASGSSFRLTGQRLPEVSAVARTAAEEVSERLGRFCRPTP